MKPKEEVCKSVLPEERKKHLSILKWEVSYSMVLECVFSSILGSSEKAASKS